jgi:hypothetical protein
MSNDHKPLTFKIADVTAQPIVTIRDPGPTLLTIGADPVAINLKTGDMTFGKDYKPNAAARIFWGALVAEYRDFLKWKESKPCP